MVAGVLHTLWLSGRFQGHKTCRQILTTPTIGTWTPIDAQNPKHKKYHTDFLQTTEADETVATVLARYGSKAEA